MIGAEPTLVPDRSGPSIMVQADYFCSPLWDVGPTGPDNVDPERLPLTPQLQLALDIWGARFDAILNQDYRPESAFASEAEERDFIATGRHLADRVAQELRGEYAVYDYDRGTRAIVHIP